MIILLQVLMYSAIEYLTKQKLAKKFIRRDKKTGFSGIYIIEGL